MEIKICRKLYIEHNGAKLAGCPIQNERGGHAKLKSFGDLVTFYVTPMI